jgi:hypothetical protein
VLSINKIEHGIAEVNLKEMSNTFFLAVFEFQWLSEEIDGNVAKVLVELGER